MPDDRADTGRLLREYLEAIPDMDDVAARLDEDVQFTMFAPTGRTNVGRARIVRGLEKEFASFYRREDFKLDVLESFGDGEMAAARFQITADTQRGPYKNNYCCIARFKDGLIVEAWEYLDTASAGLQLRPAAHEGR